MSSSSARSPSLSATVGVTGSRLSQQAANSYNNIITGNCSTMKIQYISNYGNCQPGPEYVLSCGKDQYFRVFRFNGEAYNHENRRLVAESSNGVLSGNQLPSSVQQLQTQTLEDGQYVDIIQSQPQSDDITKSSNPLLNSTGTVTTQTVGSNSYGFDKFTETTSPGGSATMTSTTVATPMESSGLS